MASVTGFLCPRRFIFGPLHPPLRDSDPLHLQRRAKTEHLLEMKMSLDAFENIKLLRTVLSASYFFTLKAMGPGRRLLGLREIAKCMSAVPFLNMWT